MAKFKTCKFCRTNDGNATPRQKAEAHFSYCDQHNKPLCVYCGVCPKTPFTHAAINAAIERVTRNA